MQNSRQAVIAGLLLVSAVSAAIRQEQTQRNWTRLESPNFTVYSGGDAFGAADAIEKLEAGRAFLQSTLKIGHIADFQVTVILFDGSEDFCRYEPHPNTFAFYRRHRGRNFIVLKSAHGGPARALFHEYIHATFAQIAPTLPLWLAEGLAEVYSEARKEGDTISFGLMITDHVTRLKTMPPGSLATIFGSTAASVYAHPGRVWDFYAGSWSAVRTLLTSPRYSKKISEFVLAANETGTEHALSSIYGVSTSDFATDVERHAQEGSSEPLGRAFARTAAPLYSIDHAVERDVLTMLGDVVGVNTVSNGLASRVGCED